MPFYLISDPSIHLTIFPSSSITFLIFSFFITTLTNFIRARSAGTEIIEFHKQTEIRCILTDRLVFVWFYRLLYVSWSKITGKLSRNDLHLRRYLSSDYFHPKEKSRRKKTDQEFPLFIFVTLHGIKTNSFRKSPLIVKLKSWSQMLLQKVQQSQQNLLLKRDTKINVTVTKYINLLACWYVGCWCLWLGDCPQNFTFALEASLHGQILISLTQTWVYFSN